MKDMYDATDYYLRNMDSDYRFEFIKVILKDKIGLNSSQAQAVDEIIDDIAKNALVRGFYDGLRHERDKQVAK